MSLSLQVAHDAHLLRSTVTPLSKGRRSDPATRSPRKAFGGGRRSAASDWQKRQPPPSFLDQTRLSSSTFRGRFIQLPNVVAMQPLGRPLVRAVFTQPAWCRTLPAKRTSGFKGAQSSSAQLPPPWLHPRLWGLESSIRTYSSQPPSKDYPPLPPGIELPAPKQEAPKKQEAPAKSSSPPPQPEPGTSKAPKAKAAKKKSPLDLPSSMDDRRSQVQQKFSHLMDTLQDRTLTASHKLNEMTGYTSIEAIKAENAQLETDLADAHARLRHARQAYKSSNAKRAATQREVTTLLARKETWTPTDLERFTELYRNEHVLEGEVSSAQEALTEAEADEQNLSQKLNSGILKRYHEEQVWSDRIRRASTWGTWGLMGMNFLLFVVLQFFAEPWKRRRLVKGVVAEEKQVLESVKEELAALRVEVEGQRVNKVEVEKPAEVISPPPVTTAPWVRRPPHRTWSEWQEIIQDPSRWREVTSEWRDVADDLYSERMIDLKMKEATTLALQGVAAGAALASSIVWVMMRGS